GRSAQPFRRPHPNRDGPPGGIRQTDASGYSGGGATDRRFGAKGKAMNALFNHLWQSTIFAVAVAAVVALLQRQSPRLRYWLWLSASAKFLIPFSLIVATGARIQLPKEAPALRPAT